MMLKLELAGPGLHWQNSLETLSGIKYTRNGDTKENFMDEWRSATVEAES